MLNNAADKYAGKKTKYIAVVSDAQAVRENFRKEFYTRVALAAAAIVVLLAILGIVVF